MNKSTTTNLESSVKAEDITLEMAFNIAANRSLNSDDSDNNSGNIDILSKSKINRIGASDSFNSEICKSRKHHTSIAILEDNNIESDEIQRVLEVNNYHIKTSDSGFEFLNLIASNTYDLLILDWNVPDISGLDVLEKIRVDLHISTPIIMLTCRQSEFDVVQALNRGADDYIKKPWQPFEIASRVRAMLRRQNYYQQITPVPNSDFIFDDKFQLITHKKQTSRFGRKEYFIAKQLILNIGKIVSRDLLIKELWGL